MENKEFPTPDSSEHFSTIFRNVTVSLSLSEKQLLRANASLHQDHEIVSKSKKAIAESVELLRNQPLKGNADW